MERFYTLFFVAGIGCFGIAFALSMVFPWMSLGSYHGMGYKSLQELAQEPAVEGQRLCPAVQQRRVALVHVGGDVVEQQRRSERRCP